MGPPRAVKFIQSENKVVFARVWIERGNEELLFNRYGVSVLQYEKVLKVDGAGSCPIMSMYLMPLKGTLKGVKMANFKLCIFHHNQKKIHQWVTYYKLRKPKRWKKRCDCITYPKIIV